MMDLVGGKKKMPTFGSRSQVFDGNAKKTTGGLTKRFSSK